MKDDVFTSIHIEEFEVMARDTKLGPEDITRDIPNVGEEALRNLDEAGIVYIGAEVEPGDILCGKITPKGESPMTPEEKLLRAIFGEKASDVRDTSLRLPPGVSGTVVEVRVFNRHGIDIDDRTRAIQAEEKDRLRKDADDERSILKRATFSRLREMLIGQTATAAPKGFKKGSVIDAAGLEEVERFEWWKFAVKDDKVQADLEAVKAQYDEAEARDPPPARGPHREARARRRAAAGRAQDGQGVRRGEAQAPAGRQDGRPPRQQGRHQPDPAQRGHAVPRGRDPGRHRPQPARRAVANERRPDLRDPSRLGRARPRQADLGDAGGHSRPRRRLRGQGRQGRPREAQGHLRRELRRPRSMPSSDDELHELASNLVGGVPMGTPVFDGAREADVSAMLEKAGLDQSGQVTLFDGRTGDTFDRKVTVGYIYMLKLHHLVDDKIHARSIGPYSLVTQQPLGGKAQFGGQRFGEMEVWALQAYGAAYTLQEMLTVKSDDVIGRTKVYEAIVKGDDTFEAGIPESFNVLVKEMRSLGLNVELNSVVDTDADGYAEAAE